MSCNHACTISWQENVCGCVYFIHVWYIRKLCLTKLENLTIYSHTKLCTTKELFPFKVGKRVPFHTYFNENNIFLAKLKYSQIMRKLCLTKLENLTIYSHTYPNSHLELLLPGVDGQFKTLPTGFMFYFSSYVTVENVKQCNLCTSISSKWSLTVDNVHSKYVVLSF
jgi:hypothetical protein